MDEFLIALLIFVCLVGASLGTLATYQKLPPHHRQDDTNAVVRLVANIFVVMTSLVMGLMINSARTAFETIDHDVHALATELIILDRMLVEFGPEMDEAHLRLVAYVEQAIAGTWPDHGSAVVSDKTAERLLHDVGTSIRAAAAPDADDAALLPEIREQYRKVVSLRWTLVEQAESFVRGRPFVFMLAAWLVLIFASFGYRAPRNAVVVSAFVISAGLISGAIFLVMDMDQPFSGPMQISPAPLQRVLAEMRLP